MPLWSKAPASDAGTCSGVQARFFQPSITPASCRAGHRLSSICVAAINCFIRRSWSSVSKMVKLLLRPANSACRRKIFTQMEWNVPIHGMPSTCPIKLPTRFFISRAALFVKVTERISLGRAVPVLSKCAMRVVKALVLPVPAPASIKTGPSNCSTAARCAGFNPSI